MNLATEAATVSFDPQAAGLSELTAAVAAAGYTATPRHAAGPQPASRDDQDAATTAGAAQDAQLRDLKRKWQVTLTTGLGLMALMYLPLNLDTMDWLMPAIFVVATVLQFWAGRGFYAAAWAAARHGATNMNTLVALGTGVAWGYSAFVTLWPGIAERAGLPLHLYFETSLVIIALILMGRWMELRARKRTAAAITALVGLAPKTARVIRDGRGPAVTPHSDTPHRPGPEPQAPGPVPASYAATSHSAQRPMCQLALGITSGTEPCCGLPNGPSRYQHAEMMPGRVQI